MKIRFACENDAENLAQVARMTFADTFAESNTKEDMELHCRNSYGKEIQKAEILDGTKITIVCELDGKIIAYSQMNLNVGFDSKPLQSSCEIQRFYVTKEWHGKGIAQKMMQFCLDTARAKSMKSVWLGVWEKNPRAIKFYQKFGFVEKSEHVFLLGSDRQRDIIMNKIFD